MISIHREASGGRRGHLHLRTPFRVVTSSVGPRQQLLRSVALNQMWPIAPHSVKLFRNSGQMQVQSAARDQDCLRSENGAAIFAPNLPRGWPRKRESPPAFCDTGGDGGTEGEKSARCGGGWIRLRGAWYVSVPAPRRRLHDGWLETLRGADHVPKASLWCTGRSQRSRI